MINSKNFSLTRSGLNMMLTSIDSCASILASEGMKEKTFDPFLLYSPCPLEIIFNFISKLEIFFIWKLLSHDSPKTTPPMFNNPSSGIT